MDGQIAQLKRPLTNGEIVEVITKAGSHPAQDWLSFVETSRARNKIKQWLNAERRLQAIAIGQRLLEKEARAVKVPLNGSVRIECSPSAASTDARTPTPCMRGWGTAGSRCGRSCASCFPEGEVPDPGRLRQQPPVPEGIDGQQLSSGDDTLEVQGVDDVLIYRARCCNPIPGEPIVGYVTRGKGVGVHSANCANVQSLIFEAERRIDVRWAPKAGVVYQAG